MTGIEASTETIEMGPERTGEEKIEDKVMTEKGTETTIETVEETEREDRVMKGPRIENGPHHREDGVVTEGTRETSLGTGTTILGREGPQGVNVIPLEIGL